MGLFARNSKNPDEKTDDLTELQRYKRLEMKLINMNRRIDRLESKLDALDQDIEDLYSGLDEQEDTEEPDK